MSLTRLTALADDVWATSHAWMDGLHFRSRMVVVRLADGALWLYSPVPVDDALAAELDALGPVGHLVAPNLNHHLFLAAAKARYPKAVVWGAPGLVDKRPDLPIDRTLTEDTSAWGGVVEAVLADGVPFANEVVCFHRPSGTLICADYFGHVTDEPHGATRCFWRLFGVWQTFAQNVAWRRVFTKDRQAAAGAARRIVAWPTQRVAMAHGEVLEQDAAARVQRALGWVLAERR